MSGRGQLKETSMKPITWMLALSAGLSMVLPGCSKNEQARNAAALEKAFSTKASAPDAGKMDGANGGATTHVQGDQIQQTIGQGVSALTTSVIVKALVTV